MPTSKGKCINHSFCHGWRLTEVQEWKPVPRTTHRVHKYFPQGIHINNPYKRAFLYYISPCHCPTLAWYPAFSPGWGHGGLTNTISPLASMEGWRMSNLMLQQFLPTTWSPLPAMRDWSADRGTGHHQTQESNTCWNPIAAWGCHIICCRQHNIVCRHEESRDHSSAKTSSQSSFTRWDLFTGLNCRPPTLVFYSCFGNCQEANLSYKACFDFLLV